MKKRLFIFALCAAMVFTMFGCANLSKEPAAAETEATEIAEATEATEASETTEAPAAFPVTVTDAAGREVTINQEPQRLVSGYYITTSMLIALGQQDKLVGIEAKAGSRPIYGLSAPELLELPSVGTAKEFNLEGCAALEPDLVVLPLKLKDTVAALEELGIPVLLANPESMELLTETITILGKAKGAEDLDEALLAYN